MTSFRRVLTVFLASPTDLADERKAAKQVVDELMPTARELGISLELLGWEDTLPGAQRPQDVINKDLDQADLFVGVLWRRWGQPTGNSKYTSGFEEEFKRARARRTRSGTPEIWLFFKEVEGAQRDDAGEQLQKVLNFKARCVAEKKFFFKEFGTTEAWTKLLRSSLSQHVARQARNVTNEPEQERVHATPGGDGKRPSSDSTHDAAPSLLPLVDVLSELAKGGRPQPYATANGGINSARLYLLGLALLAESGTSADPAGTHETNTLYRLRRAFEPIPIEEDLLQRTVLSDRAGVKPGWVWFPQEEQAQLTDVVFYALFDLDANVRIGALTVLAAGRVRSDAWTPAFFTAKTAESQPAEVREAFWAYLESIVSPADRDGLEAMLIDGAAKDRVLILLRIARIATEPSAVLSEVATGPEEPSQRLIDELERNLPMVDFDVLVAAFSTRHDAIRVAIAKELALRGGLNYIRTAAQVDSVEEVRVLEYRDRLNVQISAGGDRPELPDGLSFGANRALMRERLRGLPREDLERRIEWLNPESRAAYEVLATEYWPIVAERIRADIANRFENIRLKSVERFVHEALQKVGIDENHLQHALFKAAAQAAVETELTELKEDLTDFIRGGFDTAALAAIEKHGSSEDAPFVRQFLDSVIDRDLAIRAIGRIGDESDVPKLLEIVNDSYGDTKVLAAKQALRLSADRRKILGALSQASDADIVRLALSEMIEYSDGTAKITAIGLLNSDVASVREAAVERLAATLETGELMRVLDSYVAHRPYYYNVVVAIDRALHCRVKSVVPPFKLMPWTALF